MGSVSLLLIRDDNLDRIAKDRLIGERISEGVRLFRPTGYNTIRVADQGSSCGAIDVPLAGLDSHAIGLVVVEGNTAHWINQPGFEENPSIPKWSSAESVLVDVVKKLGYDVTKK